MEAENLDSMVRYLHFILGIYVVPAFIQITFFRDIYSDLLLIDVASIDLNRFICFAIL